MEENKYKLLVKDLCNRLPYGVMVTSTDGHFYAEELSTISLDGDKGGVTQTKEGTPTYLKCTMPYLRPISSMTTDEKKELTFILNDKVNTKNFILKVQKVIDFLNRRMFDYLGLIDLDLALNVYDYEHIYEWLGTKN